MLRVEGFQPKNNLNGEQNADSDFFATLTMTAKHCVSVCLSVCTNVDILCNIIGNVYQLASRFSLKTQHKFVLFSSTPFKVQSNYDIHAK